MQRIKPTLIIDKSRVVANIRRMLAKIAASDSPVRFRPHFKTHQSLQVGRWFREEGITAITVSSVDMATFFASDGWSDITIAVLVNPLEIERLDQLAASTSLHLLIDSVEMALFLQRSLHHPVGVWIKIDTGYHRTGIDWEQREQILSVAKAIGQSEKLHFQGLLTHAGHAYGCRSSAQIKEVYADTIDKMASSGQYLLQKGIPRVDISHGDTPTCSIMENFYGVTEIRCGNFAYNDVQQLFLGSCQEEDIAVAVACPIIAKYPQRNQMVIYGGAVHLSKDYAIDASGEKNHGLVAVGDPNALTWGPLLKETRVISLSQEHGIIQTTSRVLNQVQVGDRVMILPVHSCLTAQLAAS